jgi:hypothetical protein
MKIRVTITTSSERQLVLLVDEESYREYYQELTTNGANPRMVGVSFEGYMRPLKVDEAGLEALNHGRPPHFLFGFIESFYQSDEMPQSWWEDNVQVVSYEVTWS